MAFDRIRALIRRRVRYQTTYGGWLFFAALAVTAALAFVSGNNLLFLLFAAMLALLLVSGFLSRLVLAGLEVELLLPHHVAARMMTAARIRIRNLKRLTPSFSIEVGGWSHESGAGQSDPPILTEPLYFPLITGRQSIEASANVRFSRRGRHREDLFILTTSFPFGLLRKSVIVALRRETIVYPALEGSPEAEFLLEAIQPETGAEVRVTGSDFYRIRPYVPDDNARHVDWKSTAHTGALQVREFARDEERRIEIWFDRAIVRGAENDFEELVERCAFVAWNLAERGKSLSFRCDDTLICVPEAGEIYDILRFLALAEPLVVEVSKTFEHGQPVDFSSPGDPSGNDSSLTIVFSTRAPLSES